MDLEAQKKAVVPYLQRAEEIQAVDPKVAYYCRLWAVDQALKLPSRHKEIDGLLRSVLALLEKEKPKVAPLDPESDRYHVENFAANIFRRANRVDRAGRANADTAKAFYAASIFYDVLNQFGELEPDLVEKQKYSLWRAADINKAIREGRAPTPPPAAEGGAADDLFAGPPVDDAAAASGSGSAAAAGPPPPPPAAAAGPGSFGGGAYPSPPGAPFASASTDSEIRDLPSAPSGAPPAIAASLGARFKQGARVLAAGAGAAPEPGTVGVVVSAVGPDPVYKVAFRDRVADVKDGGLAPDVGSGARVVFVDAVGSPGIAATVLASNLGSWPCTYLLRCDNGRDIPASYGQITLALDPQSQVPKPQPAGGGPGKALAGAAAAAAAAVAAAVRAGAAPQAPAPAAAPAAAAAAAPAVPTPVPGFQPSLQAVQEAQKAAKYAVSSLSFDDVSGAVKYLSEALRLLTQPGGGGK